ncbi:hypothetical protein [Sphingopyxis sp.]
MGNLDAITVAAWRRRRNRWVVSVLLLNWGLVLAMVTIAPGAGS